MIGTQMWMKEDLKVTRYRNGDTIETTDSVNLNIIDELDPKYQWEYPDNGIPNGSDYGRLYTWYTITDSRNICPAGWHVPTFDEWTILERTLCSGQTCDEDFSFEDRSHAFCGTDEGGKLKDTAYWDSPNTGATNSSNFTALPSGIRYPSGYFSERTHTGRWWASTDYDVQNAYCRALFYTESRILRSFSDKSFGFTVRCVKNDSTFTDVKYSQDNKWIQIFPNPVNNILYINNNRPANIKARIFNVNGECVLYELISSEKIQINVGNLVPGIYLVDLYNDTMSYRKVVVKN